jgi:hypothetical protein
MSPYRQQFTSTSSGRPVLASVSKSIIRSIVHMLLRALFVYQLHTPALKRLAERMMTAPYSPLVLIFVGLANGIQSGSERYHEDAANRHIVYIYTFGLQLSGIPSYSA